MEKIYIPTSSLNFNNLFSNGSISPARFYTFRQFGYKRFNSIFEINREGNFIIGFNKFPYYSLDDSEQDNFPLVIEYFLEDYFDFEEIELGDNLKAFGIGRTLYFSPENSRFHFFSDQHKKLTLISSQASLETKLVSQFERNFLVTLAEKLDCFRLNLQSNWFEPFKGIKNIALESQNDMLVDKLRGFSVGYIFGKTNSYDEASLGKILTFKGLNDDISFIKNIYLNYTKLEDTGRRKLKLSDDIFYKIWNMIKLVESKCGQLESSENARTRSKSKSLAEHLQELRLPNKSIDEINDFLDAFKIILPSSNKTVFDELDKMLRLALFQEQRGIQEIPKILKALFGPNKFPYPSMPKDPFGFIENILQETENKLIKSYTYVTKIDPEFYINFRNFSFQEMSLSGLTPLENSILTETLTKLIQIPVSNMDEFLSNRLDIAMTIGKEFKSRIKSWDKSREKKFFNELLSHLDQHTPFNPEQTESLLLKSIACTLIKGHEIEKLESYLISNKIANHSISFALWGAIYGLSIFPKDYFNRIDLQNQKIVFDHIPQVHERISVVREPRQTEYSDQLSNMMELVLPHIASHKKWNDKHADTYNKLINADPSRLPFNGRSSIREEFGLLISKKFNKELRECMLEMFDEIWNKNS